jgi:hypothetical protein
LRCAFICFVSGRIRFPLSLQVDAMPTATRWTVRTALVAICLGVGQLWYQEVYVLPKLDYNKLHPYTSWIPITVFILLRNITPGQTPLHQNVMSVILMEVVACHFVVGV